MNSLNEKPEILVLKPGVKPSPLGRRAPAGRQGALSTGF